MFGKIWTWAGNYRTTEKSIEVVPYKIPMEMINLQDEMNFWNQSNIFNPIEISARIHHRLVWIHPYENGNGRHGRLIGDMILRAYHHPYTRWPSFNRPLA